MLSSKHGESLVIFWIGDFNLPGMICWGLSKNIFFFSFKMGRYTFRAQSDACENAHFV